MDSIKNFFKKIKWESLIASIVAIAIGIMFVVVPSTAGNVVCYVLGGVLIALGLLLVIRQLTADFLLFYSPFLIGLVMISIGILCFARPEVVKSLFTIIFGLYLIVDGLSKIPEGVNCVKLHIKGSWLIFVMAGISLALGFIVMFGTMEYIMIICGASLIVDGIIGVIYTLMFSSYIRKTHKQVKKLFESHKDELDNFDDYTIE